MADLHGQVVLITGAAGAIGRATARRCLDDGAAVVLVDRSPVSLEGWPPERVHAVAADVTSPEDSARFVAAAIERFGRLDSLVANAGVIGTSKPIAEYPVEVLRQVLEVNVVGVFLSLQAALPALRDGGSVVLLSSIAGVRGYGTGTSAYIASKHAVVGLTRCAAQECAPRGIRVNAVAPAPIEGPMMRAIESAISPEAPEAVVERVVARIPLGRYGRPDEVAALIVWLLGDDSRYCTGGVYPVDGGLTAR